MKLLVWNIRQGGGALRRQRIADCLIGHEPDVIALIEFVPSTAGALLGALREAGFTHEMSTVRNGFDYAVCVLSKMPVVRVLSQIPVLDDSGLWLEVAIPERGFSVGVVHAPTERWRMKSFLDGLVQVASGRADHPFLFAGDFNTGIGPGDGPIKNYGDVDRFIALQGKGFTDAWRHLRRRRLPDVAEYTYTFPRTGKCYRIDHALASASMLPRIQDCRYSHVERECGASDHSAVVVEIDD